MIIIKYKLKGRMCSVRVSIRRASVVIASLLTAGAELRSVKWDLKLYKLIKLTSSNATLMAL